MGSRAKCSELLRRQRKTESSVRSCGIRIVVSRIRRITQARRQCQWTRASLIVSQHDSRSGNQNRAAASSCIDSAKRIDHRDSGGSASGLGVIAADACGIDDARAGRNRTGNMRAK